MSVLDASSFVVEQTASGSPYVTLQTKGSTPVYLTNLYSTDVAGLTALMTHPDVNSRLKSVPFPYTADHAEEWIKIQTAESEAASSMRELPLTAIRVNAPDEAGLFIGSIGLRPLDASKGEYIMGYGLHPSYHRQGIISAAVRASLWYAAIHRQVAKTVIIQVAADNENSRKVVERFGGFVPVENGEELEDWPEAKGGGQKLLKSWRWTVGEQ